MIRESSPLAPAPAGASLIQLGHLRAVSIGELLD